MNVAAVHAARVRKKRAAELRSRLVQYHQAEQKKADAWFNQFDTDRSGALDETQLVNLLTALEPETPPSRGMARFIIEQAAPTGITRQNVVATVSKYRAYSQKQLELDAIFLKYDTNQSGVLEPEQLKALMADSSEVEPTDGDVDFILEQCDLSESGSISRDEALATVATWGKLVVKKRMAVRARTCLVS